jgi:hypothetical protein
MMESEHLLEAANYVIIGSLIVAFLSVWGIRRKIPKATDDAILIAPGKYDPKNSWITNATVFGAILGAPIKDLSAHGSINSLNVLFLALGSIALLITLATTQPGKDNKDQDINVSRVRPYLWSARVALWAAIGQLVTLGYMISIAEREVLSYVAKAIFLLSILAAFFVLGLFACRTIAKHLESAVKPSGAPTLEDTVEAREPRLMALDTEPATPAPQRQPAHIENYSATL